MNKNTGLGSTVWQSLESTFLAAGHSWAYRATHLLLVEDMEKLFGYHWPGDIPAVVAPILVVEDAAPTGTVEWNKERRGILAVWDDSWLMTLERSWARVGGMGGTVTETVTTACDTVIRGSRAPGLRLTAAGSTQLAITLDLPGAPEGVTDGLLANLVAALNRQAGRP